MTSRLDRFRLRESEWVLAGFFCYVAAIAPFFERRPNLGLRPVVELVAVLATLLLLSALEEGRWAPFVSRLRDWLPILFTLAAFREMELFLPREYGGHLEAAWIRLDRTLLDRYHLRDALQILGPLIPLYLEICYFLVYGVGLFCVGILYGRGKRALVDRFWTIYLTATLLAYAIFPYFPSQPPRIAFPALDNPAGMTWIRQLNLFILNKGSIHVGVFPSAHVSSAFACAWAMFLLIPERKSVAWWLVFYAFSVSIATIYGRYHYAADVIAGFAVSLVAGALAIAIAQKQKKGREL